MNNSDSRTGDIRLQILLLPEHRNAAGAKRAVVAARQVGLSTSGVGTASLSARVPQAQFTELFGAGLDSQASLRSVALSQTPLAVPKPLAPYVESITVVPQHEQY